MTLISGEKDSDALMMGFVRLNRCVLLSQMGLVLLGTGSARVLAATPWVETCVAYRVDPEAVSTLEEISLLNNLKPGERLSHEDAAKILYAWQSKQDAVQGHQDKIASLKALFSFQFDPRNVSHKQVLLRAERDAAKVGFTKWLTDQVTPIGTGLSASEIAAIQALARQQQPGRNARIKKEIKALLSPFKLSDHEVANLASKIDSEGVEAALKGLEADLRASGRLRLAGGLDGSIFALSKLGLIVAVVNLGFEAKKAMIDPTAAGVYLSDPSEDQGPTESAGPPPPAAQALKTLLEQTAESTRRMYEESGGPSLSGPPETWPESSPARQEYERMKTRFTEEYQRDPETFRNAYGR